MTASPPPVPPDALGLAHASYDRCCSVSDFFPSFYRDFFKRRPDVEAMFAATDFEKQHRLLRHAIGLLLAFPTKPEDGPMLLRRVAERHGRDDLNIDPALYPDWVESLIANVADHDEEFTPAVEAAWRAAIAPGIAFMLDHA